MSDEQPAIPLWQPVSEEKAAELNRAIGEAPREPAPPTIDTAKDVIQRAKDCRGECDVCERVSFHTLYERHMATGSVSSIVPEGFETMPNAAGVIKRCQSCADTPLYPWADQLDPERVLTFMQAHNDHAWSLSALQELLS